jgi:hypothetical protein
MFFAWNITTMVRLLAINASVAPFFLPLRIRFVPMQSFINQTLAALANLKTGVIQSRLRHSKSGEGAVGFVAG